MLGRNLRIVSMFCVVALLGAALPVLAQEPAPAYVEGEIIVKLREKPDEQLAKTQGRLPVQDRAARLRALRDRFGFRRARSIRGMPAAVSPASRARLLARRARAGRPPAAEIAEKALAEFSRVYVVKLAEGEDVERRAAELRADPDVEYAHPNYIAHALFTPNDPFWPTAGSWGQSEDDLWGLKLLETEQAWDTTLGAGVVVAVLDTGVDFSHPDLAANAWVNPGHGAFPPEIANNGVDDDNNGYIDDVNGFDFTRSIDGNGDGDYNDPEDTIEPDPIDEYGHGTHVAGTIAAVGNNAEGIIGVAPQVQIMAVRGLDASGSGSLENLAAGMVYAALNGADVINNSWGCSVCVSIPFVEDAVRLAHDLDVVVVFAAGNNNDNAIRRSPQNMSETIAVSALTPTDEKTSFTSFGPLVDVGAPGGGVDEPGVDNNIYNVLSLQVPGSTLDVQYPNFVVAPGYTRLAGTSMATPHAAGVAALLRAHDPTLSNEQIRQILRLASDPIVTTSPFLGYGRVNARKVLESTLNVEMLIETPTAPFRTLEDPVEVSGYARGPNLQNVQVSLGPGQNASQFIPVPTTWSAITGAVTATVDASDLPDGFAILRLEADDGTQTYSSSAGVQVDNVAILAPTPNEIVQGTIDVVVDVGSSSYLQRVVVTYFNHLTNQTETLLDTTTISGPVLTIPFDTTGSIDSTELQAIRPTITVETHFDVNGELFTRNESVAFQIDNDRITSPTRGSFTTDPSPFDVVGTALHDVEIQIYDGSGWATVGSSSAGAFSVSVDPAAFVDLQAQNLVVVRLVADVDGDAVFSDAEQNELVQLFVDTELPAGWPQQGGETAGTVKVTVGDLDADGADELVAVPDGSSSILVYDGSGALNAAIAAGSQQFQAPNCGNQAALHDLDGLPGLELIWASWGQIAALRYDGTPPAGFVPDVFNDGTFDFFAHQDPDYTELYPCRPATPFTTNNGELRIVQGTRLFDWNGPKLGGVIPQNFLKNKVLLFDATGALVNEVDRGPGRNNNVKWSVADIDLDGAPEIVTNRAEVLGPNNEVDATLLVYDALTLAPELELTLNQTSLGTPVLADLDGDGDLEIVIPGSQHPPVGEFGPSTPTLFAFHHDGTPVAGFSHTANQLGEVAAGNLDLDSAAELVISERTSAGNYELVLLDYDAATQQLQVASGWPVPLASSAGTILLADIDGDLAPEIVYQSNEPWYHSVGTRRSTIFRRYFVSALELDGSPWQGGWERSVRGVPSLAIGNLDGSGAAELAVGYSVIAVPVGDPEYQLPEVLAYSLAGVFSPAGVPWNHQFGNAQQSGATRAQCQDGVDNDDDGVVDDLDPECTGPLDPVEVCGLGPELLLVLPPLYWLARRRRSRRNR